MTYLLDYLVFQSALSWGLIGVTLGAIVLMPRLFGVNFFSGLLFSQITIFFNATTIIAGLDNGAVSVARAFHFYIIEFSFLALVFSTYRYLLKRRAEVLLAVKRFFDGNGAIYATVLVAAMSIFNYWAAPSDGSSRISYMTEQWFSLLKPFIQIAAPLSYMGVFVLLLSLNRRRMGYILLAISILGNIATGSKASFALNLLTALLVFRDLNGSGKFRIGYQDKVKLILVVGVAVIFTLARLEVTVADILNRFFLFGEATILTYFSNDPTAACTNVSIFASMHRGWARLLGDPSAQDLDTLFGFALTIQELGVNTFTGPNGRLSAYFLCNFAGEKFVFGLFVVSIYIWLMRRLFKRLLIRPSYLATAYPFLVVSLGGASQDFNLIMQDINIFIMLFLPTLFFYVPKRRKLG